MLRQENVSITNILPPILPNTIVGAALMAGQTDGFGRWAIMGNTLTLYGPDGSTVVRRFALNSPTQETLK